MKIPKKASRLDVMVAASEFILERTEKRMAQGGPAPDRKIVAQIEFRDRNDALEALAKLARSYQAEKEAIDRELAMRLIEDGLAGNA